MQVYPQFENLPKTVLAAATLISQSFSRIIGHFPPNSKIHGIKFLAAA